GGGGGGLGGGIDVDVGPLDDAAGAELARELLHARGVDDDAAVAWIARESEGRPFFVEELSRHAAGGETHPVSLRTLLAERVAALAPEPRRLLETVATPGGPVRFDVAARAARLAGGAAAEAAAPRDGACLTGAAGSLAAKELETLHDRIRELVVELLGEDEGRERHRALAEAIEAFGGGEDDAALAMHWLAAGERERAARHSEGAALRAGAALAFDQAASLLRRALELSAPREAPRLHALLGAALARAGKSREAATALLAAVDGADAEQALALQRRAAEQLLRGGHLADGAEVIRRALASVGLSYPATPRRALAGLLWRR